MTSTEMKDKIVDILHRGLSKGLITPFDSTTVLDTLHNFLSKYPNYRPQPARYATTTATTETTETTARHSTSKLTSASTSATDIRETAELEDEAEREARDETELWKTIQPILDKAQEASGI